MWETGGRFYARILDVPAYIEVTGVSRHECYEQLRETSTATTSCSRSR